MDTPGIEVRPIKDMTTNRHFCEVFFTDVRVPAANLVGIEGAAFKQTMRQLEHERGGIDRLVSQPRAVPAGARAGRHDRSARAPGDRRDRDRLPHRPASWSSARCCGQAPAGFSAATKCFCTEHERAGRRVRRRARSAPRRRCGTDVTHGLRLRPRLHDHGRHVERDAQHPRRARARPPPRAPLTGAGLVRPPRTHRAGRHRQPACVSGRHAGVSRFWSGHRSPVRPVLSRSIADTYVARHR